MGKQHVAYENSSANPKRKRKSGKNSRFLQKAKKFGKQGKLGHGHEVDSETYNYFLRVLEVHNKNEFDGDEERVTFVRNSLEQSVGEEVNFAKNQMISRVLESILPGADEDVLERFCQAFTPQLRVICADPYASHVLEKLLEITSTQWAKNHTLITWFRSTSKFILNNYAEFAFDKYANAVMRKVFLCLNGTVTDAAKNSNAPKSTKLLSVRNSATESKLQPENAEILRDFHSAFLGWHQFNDLLGEVNTSALVQVFTQAVRVIDEDLAYQAAVQTLKAIKADFELDKATILFTLENCVQIANPSLYEFMFTKYFESRLEDMVCHSKAQHTVRKLITACPSSDIFEKIFDIIEPKFAELLKLDYTNILVACAETCKRLAMKQSEFSKGIKSILPEESDEEFIMKLAKFNKSFPPRADGTGTTFQLDLNGCLVLQHMLDFHKPAKIVKGMLGMDTRQIAKLAADPKGSHIMDSFFKSETIGDKNKEKMVVKLKEDLVGLACSKFGSRVLDAMWSWASIKQKAIIASALCDKVSKLNADPFGKFLSEKMALHSYKGDAKKWEEFQKSSGKRKAELEDFTASITAMTNENIADASEEPKKKKKKKKSKQDNNDD